MENSRSHRHVPSKLNELLPKVEIATRQNHFTCALHLSQATADGAVSGAGAGADANANAYLASRPRSVADSAAAPSDSPTLGVMLAQETGKYFGIVLEAVAPHTRLDLH